MYSLLFIIPIILFAGFFIAFKESKKHFDNSDLR